MARVEYGSIITDIKGSLGGHSFQHNSSGKIIRTKPSPPKTQTLKQKNQHLNTADLNISWQSLTLEFQTDWNNYAALHQRINNFGNLRTLTGYNWFFTINSNLMAFGNLKVDTPPVYALPTALNQGVLNLEATEFFVSFTLGWSPVDSGLFVFATKPIFRPSNNFDRYLLKIFTGATTSLSKLHLMKEWNLATLLNYESIYVKSGFYIGLLIIPINTKSGVPGTPQRLIATPI